MEAQGQKRDLQKIRKKLLQQGVFFQAAAIGSDKEAIQEIYEESFLDITDLEQLPALLTKNCCVLSGGKDEQEKQERKRTEYGCIKADLCS